MPTTLFVLGQSVECVFLLCSMVGQTIKTFFYYLYIFFVTLEKRLLDFVFSLFDDYLKYVYWNLGVQINNVTG